MSQWQETYRVPARVTLSDGETLEGDLHLQTGSALHAGGETALEMLNRPELYFAVSLPGGEVALVAKTQTVVVACKASLWTADPDRIAISKRFELDVGLVGGGGLSGVVYWEFPPTHPRPQDFLNAPGAFFELSDGGTVHCVNRSLVTRVHPTE